MGSLITFALFFLIALSLVSGQQQGRKKDPVPEITQKCLDCICQASTDCNPKARCHNAGGNAYLCGLYLISWGYWHEAGRPGDRGSPHDFETCLNDKTCAEKSVRGYMKKHGQDCDRDGSISCYDFSRIHKLGPGNCGSDSIEPSEYWEKFRSCYEGDISSEAVVAEDSKDENYDYYDSIDAPKQQSR